MSLPSSMADFVVLRDRLLQKAYSARVNPRVEKLGTKFLTAHFRRTEF